MPLSTKPQYNNWWFVYTEPAIIRISLTEKSQRWIEIYFLYTHIIENHLQKLAICLPKLLGWYQGSVWAVKIIFEEKKLYYLETYGFETP